MYFVKAIKVLGLSSNFTEQELKKAYHNLMRKYHPDVNIGESETKRKELEEKAKEVNNAYDYLIKIRESRSLNEYIDFLTEELRKYNNESVFYSELTPYQTMITSLIADFFFNTGNKSKAEVDQIFQESKKEIRSVFDKLRDKYFKQYGINQKYAKELNYEVSLQEFYDQLKKIKEQFLEQVIAEVRQKYQNYKGYDYLKELIGIVAIFNFKIYVEKNGLEKAIDMVHQEIEGLFDLYFRIVGKFTMIEERLESNDSNLKQEFLEQMKQEHDKILAFFQKKRALDDVENQLDELKRKIDRQIQLENQAKIFNPLFAKIMAKYYESIQKYQIINDTNKIYSLTKTLEMVIQIFNLVITRKIEFDSFLLLEHLTFDDELIDANIISSVCNSLTVANERNIYLKKNSYLLGISIWSVLEEKDGILYLKYYDSILGTQERVVTKEEVKEDYILLDAFLKEMKLVGKGNGVLNILYSNDLFDVVLYDGELDITTFTPLEFLGHFDIPIEYQNKEYVKIKLLEMINKKLNQGISKSRKVKGK